MIKSAFSCCSKETNKTGDSETNDVDHKGTLQEDPGENYLEENKEAAPTKSSTQVRQTGNQKEDCSFCFGAKSILTFFDNVRALFSQGRSVDENSKYSRILVIATIS